MFDLLIRRILLPSGYQYKAGYTQAVSHTCEYSTEFDNIRHYFPIIY